MQKKSIEKQTQRAKTKPREIAEEMRQKVCGAAEATQKECCATINRDAHILPSFGLAN